VPPEGAPAGSGPAAPPSAGRGTAQRPRLLVLEDGRRIPVRSWGLSSGRVRGVAPDGARIEFPSSELDLAATLEAELLRTAGPIPASPAEPEPGGITFLGWEEAGTAPARTQVPEDPPRDEGFWRALAEEARRRVTDGEAGVMRLEKELADARRLTAQTSLDVASHGGAREVALWHPELREALEKARQEEQAKTRELADARARLEKARRELEQDLPEAARRAGALPGWLRP